MEVCLWLCGHGLPGIVPTRLVVAPSDPTSSPNGTFVHDVCSPATDGWCTLSCMLDGVPLPDTYCVSPIDVGYVGPGPHNL